MRRLLTMLLLLCLLPGAALAEPEGVPGEVQALIDEYYGQRLPVKYLGFTLEDGREVGIAIVAKMSVLGFEQSGDGWKITLQTYVTDELNTAYLERVPGDPLAFHVTKADNTARMTYRYDGAEFRLVGWVFPGYQPVTVDGDMLTYGEAFSTVVPVRVTDWPWSADDLPLTPETALALAAISEQNARGMFPGYTMRGYSAFNDGFMADASYSRIDENGVLHIRRAVLAAGQEPQVIDGIPVPLSEALLARLETEPFDDLISCWANDETFRTQDAFSREALSLPDDAILLDTVVHEKSMIALVEESGLRRLYVWEADEDGYVARRTQPLPADAYLDTFHAGDGVIQFEWDDQNMSASFTRREDGQWLLSWCTCWGPSADIHFSANAFGITFFDEDVSERMRVGTLQDSDLFRITLSDLNGGAPDLDPTGWAVVSNPNPADRLHLRTSADKGSHSQGKFYNGTPVKVLRQSGSWTKVQLGFGATARTGWMMTKYLAFGADMDKVQDAFPELIYREEYEHENRLNSSGFWVVGVDEDGSTKQYILLGLDGEVSYVPQSWLFGGYG